MVEEEQLSLIAPGCLGTCWYGKYHYLEPWVGCEHTCHYCYAHFRSAVTDKLEVLDAPFEKPVPLYEPDVLLAEIQNQVNRNNVKILKLSRYTDVFTPTFVRNGLSFKVLQTLCESPVERIIITTKGAPDEQIFRLIEKYRHKFSFNVVAKPQVDIPFEPNASPLDVRLDSAARINRTGALTTIHMDPIVIGIEDEEGLLREFFHHLQWLGLNRVMFSFLLLSPPIIAHLRKTLGDGVVDRILSFCEQEDTFQCLPTQAETTYISATPENRKRSIERIAGLLNEMNFEYVLCSIKNDLKSLKVDRKHCNVCNGSFYA